MGDSEHELNEMQSIIEEFMIETNEIVDSLDANLVKLERESGNLDLLNEIFRGAHTMKGTSGFLGFNELTRITHRMEDVLNLLRKNELRVTTEVMDVLLKAVDHVKYVLQDIIDNKQGNTDLTQIIEDLTKIYESKSVTAVRATGLIGLSDTETFVQTGPEKKATSEKVEAKVLDNIVQDNAADEKKLAKKGMLRKVDSTIRVGVDRLDSLVNMVGELVLGRNALVQTAAMLQAEHEGERSFENLVEASSQINFITTELHLAIMKMRMLQVGNVFNKFPRVVRDFSRELSKKIDLVIAGEETELDKSVIEEINDPLVHLIRNSVDHGIESPAERKKAGKSEKGTINLSAFQEGNNIVIQVRDDGQGMKIEAIKKKALERGLATSKTIEKASQKELLDFIFQPGFSTAAKTTSVSGRGVGMDVVRTNIEKLKGQIELFTEEGKGSLVTIKLPLTLAIVQGLLVSCGNDIFAIPLTSVKETVIVSSERIKYINQKPAIKLRDTILPLVELTEVLFNRKSESRDQLRVVVVGLAEKQIGLIVDSLIGQEEVVIKTMGDYLGNTPGVAGATIMGDGRARLIIDLAGLFELVLKNS